MENIFDRLQFVRHDEVFASREDAYNYVLGKQIVERPSLVAEPMILLYESGDETKGPNVILAIGSVGDGTANQANKTFFIDTQKTEEEIIALDEKIEQAIKSLILVPVESSTLDISTEKTDEGTIISGDVKIADYTIASGKVQNNIITVEGEKGLYAFVDMDYDPETFVITFNVNGVTKDFQLPPDQHVEKGWYSPADEAIFLKLADGSKVKIDVVKLIDEWTVLSGASETPITLFKEHVSAYTESHDGVYDWQDILTADVRVADHISDNILHKDRTGKYLYVKGTADNIKYKNNQTVADALDSIDTRVSTSAGNLIYKRPDGLYASAMLDYNSAENKLIYRYTDNQTQDFKEVSFTLNSVKILQDITYDPVKEVIVIRYIDAQGEYQRVEIPAKDIIEEWIVNNEAHNIELIKYRSAGEGKDILSADAKIHTGDNNILVDIDHKLYVNGIADNIKYDVTGETTVKDVLDNLSGNTVVIEGKLDVEIERAKAAEKELEDTIGTGFTSDPHENVTAKFETLNEKVDAEIERATGVETELQAAIEAEGQRAQDAETALDGKIDAEIERATNAESVLEGRVETIEEEIGEGFGPRNTVRDEIDNLQSEIDAVSADSASSIKDIINTDNSIGINKTDPVKPVIKVNLSKFEAENTIRLEGDGLYNFVDLGYNSTTNVLTLTKSSESSTENVTKEIQLNSISVIDNIYYDAATEELVIEYHSGSEAKVLRIPIGQMFDEWEVYNDPESAIVLAKVRDVQGDTLLSGTVTINTAHTDNMLVNEHGSLYVSGQQIQDNKNAIDALKGRMDNAESDIDTLEQNLANEISRATSAETRLEHLIEDERDARINADSILQNNISTEATRARENENRIEAALNNEINRAQTKEGELNTAITNETLRAQAADNELYQKIADEIADRAAGDTTLSAALSTEISRAQVAENIISEALNTEVARSTNEDQAIRALLDSETAARQEGDSELEQMILDATLTFANTTTTKMNKSSNNVVTTDVIVPVDDNIIIVDEGIKANVKLSYNAATNTLLLEKTSSSGHTFDTIQLNAGSIIESITYDNESKELVIRYESTSEPGVQHETRVGVSDLFNPWIVNNPSEKSAVELTKAYRTGPLAEDELSAKILITDDRNGDGKPDEGSDNLIEIKNNGLYVDGSKLSGTVEAIECVKNECKSFEKSVLGHFIGEECGSGYTYEPHNTARYINTATSFTNADYILDQTISIVDEKVENVSADIQCVDGKADSLYKMLYNNASPMPTCGSGATYQPYIGACIISGATSFMEADQLLNDQICEILTMWVSGKTCSTESEWVQEGVNRKMQVDVRLSRGNHAEQTDDDVIIETLSGPYIDPTRTEFTDTNALRIVCLTEGPSGTTPSVNSMQNGVYLSNVWDCGLYYDEETESDAIAAAQAAGYKTDNYRTDTGSTASNYNYMNNVRQTDIPSE